jgi:hypothetical protein
MDMKHFSFLLLVLILSACTNQVNKVSKQPGIDTANGVLPPETGSVDNDHLILPGQRIGRTHLGISTEELIALLNKPHSSDAAMGKAWLSWYGEGNRERRLDIYTTYADSNMTKKVVKVIRINSPVFATSEGLRTGSGLKEIRNVFPNLYRAARKIDKQELYLVDNKGIGFIVAGVRCTDILVYARDMDITNLYLP